MNHILRVKQNTLELLDKIISNELLSQTEVDSYISLKQQLETISTENDIMELICKMVESGCICPGYFNNT